MKLDSESVHLRISRLLRQRKHFVLATIVETKGSCPQQPGAKVIIHPDGSFEFTIGGGTFEAEVIRDGLAIMNTGTLQSREYRLTKGDLGMYCQGLVKVYFELYVPKPRLLICGGGHVGQSLSRIASATNLFHVVVADDRREYASKEKHPAADRVIHTDRTFTKKMPPVDAQTYVVIVTRCHATDQLLVKKYAPCNLAYIGVIGSKAKIRQFAKELKADGFPEALFCRLHAPIGIPIGGKNPAEIAISILAELIQVKNQKASSPSVPLQVTQSNS